MRFDWQIAWDVLPSLLGALKVTALATVYGMALAAVLGLVWAIAVRSRVAAIGMSVRPVVEFVRSTPVLVQVYFLFYVGPEFGVSLSPWMAGILALGIHYSAYLAEVYRAGIDAVPRGQWEASRALHMSRYDTWRHVILPQAIPPVIPVMGNYLVAMLKDTPMLSAITVLELLQTAKIYGSEHFRYLEPLTLAGVLFLVLSLGSSALIRWGERRFRVEAT